MCVTSSNAEKIVNALKNDNIYFIPDKNLGAYIAGRTNKNVILNDGCCPIHNSITPEAVKSIKENHPEAEVLMHPECTAQTLELADYIGSTSGIINYAAKSNKNEFIIVTENGVLAELCAQCPEKSFYFPEPVPVCADMKKITLEKVLSCLKDGTDKIELNNELSKAALIPLNKMLELAK